MRRAVMIILDILLGINWVLGVQPAIDTLLFTITLNEDSTSIYGCRWDDKVSSTLAGPVMMAGKHLLFYSRHGYVLYNEKGKLLDSYSLMKKNAAAARKNEPPLRLAYPIDSAHLVFYREKEGGTSPDEIYLKKIFSKSLKKVPPTAFDIYRQLTDGQLFNLAANSITDEMNRRNYLMPLLVGYTALNGGTRWWSIDRLYSFTSPLIVEVDGFCSSFFPGLKSDQKCEKPSHQIEALGVYQIQGRWYYFGIASSFGNAKDEYHQMLILCDQAGNLLYNSKIIKQEIADAVLQHIEKTNTNYTVRRAVRHVFVPAVTKDGDICYGMIDFEHKKIIVFKRFFLRYQRQCTGKPPMNVFKKDSKLAYSPLLLDCVEGSSKGIYPQITRITDEGIQKVDTNEMVKKGYFVTVHRVTDKGLKTKLHRIQSGLPVSVQRAQDSIATLVSSWCPYSIALNHKTKGRLNFFHYGLSDELLSVRILAVTADTNVYVRVDFEMWAEVVRFSPDGAFVNRFVFNNQEYTNRKDLVVVQKNGRVVEQDWETEKKKPKYYFWFISANSKKISVD